jgi:hypothetical protein
MTVLLQIVYSITDLLFDANTLTQAIGSVNKYFIFFYIHSSYTALLRCRGLFAIIHNR